MAADSELCFNCTALAIDNATDVQLEHVIVENFHFRIADYEQGTQPESFFVDVLAPPTPVSGCAAASANATLNVRFESVVFRNLTIDEVNGSQTGATGVLRVASACASTTLRLESCLFADIRLPLSDTATTISLSHNKSHSIEFEHVEARAVTGVLAPVFAIATQPL